MPSHLLFGLGNPGPRYAGSRHNVGFMVVEHLAKQLAAGQTPHWQVKRRGRFAYYRRIIGADSFVLVKPLTFVNLSGTAVTQLSSIGVDAQHIVVVYDNMDLPPGAIRLKRRGGAGGHNGITSIIGAIGTEFRRIAIGIGRPPHSGQVERYVLTAPPTLEQRLIAAAVDRICASYLDHPTYSFAQRTEQLHRLPRD